MKPLTPSSVHSCNTWGTTFPGKKPMLHQTAARKRAAEGSSVMMELQWLRSWVDGHCRDCPLSEAGQHLAGLPPGELSRRADREERAGRSLYPGPHTPAGSEG